jgi:hypothetical protein
MMRKPPASRPAPGWWRSTTLGALSFSGFQRLVVSEKTKWTTSKRSGKQGFGHRQGPKAADLNAGPACILGGPAPDTHCSHVASLRQKNQSIHMRHRACIFKPQNSSRHLQRLVFLCDPNQAQPLMGLSDVGSAMAHGAPAIQLHWQRLDWHRFCMNESTQTFTLPACKPVLIFWPHAQALKFSKTGFLQCGEGAYLQSK